MINILEIQAAMDEALGVQVKPVERPTEIIGKTETWLEVTYKGRHIGWLPADTDPNTAFINARVWLKQNREIQRAAARRNLPSAAGGIVARLAEKA